MSRDAYIALDTTKTFLWYGHEFTTCIQRCYVTQIFSVHVDFMDQETVMVCSLGILEFVNNLFHAGLD